MFPWTSLVRQAGGNLRCDGDLYPSLSTSPPILKHIIRYTSQKSTFRGFAMTFSPHKSEITMEVGGWVQASLRIFFVENRPKIALNQCKYFGVVQYTMCILSAYTLLLKVVGYYDLSVLPMSVEGFQKQQFGWGVGRWGELYPSFFWDFLNFLNFAKPLSHHHQGSQQHCFKY